jgi:hypothetical protein
MTLSTRIIVAAALLLCFAAGGSLLYRERPDLFRAKTEMEKKHPVCVLGISEPSSAVPGGAVGIRNFFISWKTSFPAGKVKAIRAAGAVPLITWEPYLEEIRRDALLPAIAEGKYDVYIASFARRSAGAPLFIRFGHEPNSDWYGWSGTDKGPKTYVKAFRRVRNIFLSQGNTTSKFIFSVNSEDVPAAAWNRFENYYPGDDAVDVVGLDAYNWGDGKESWQKWRTPGETLLTAYERTVKAFPGKPVFLTETGACANGGDKALWIEQLLASVEKRFPAIKAVVWFNYNKDCDFSLSSEEMRGKFYGSCGAGRFQCSAKSLDWLFTENP